MVRFSSIDDLTEILKRSQFYAILGPVLDILDDLKNITETRGIIRHSSHLVGTLAFLGLGIAFPFIIPSWGTFLSSFATTQFQLPSWLASVSSVIVSGWVFATPASFLIRHIIRGISNLYYGHPDYVLSMYQAKSIAKSLHSQFQSSDRLKDISEEDIAQTVIDMHDWIVDQLDLKRTSKELSSDLLIFARNSLLKGDLNDQLLKAIGYREKVISKGNTELERIFARAYSRSSIKGEMNNPQRKSIKIIKSKKYPLTKDDAIDISRILHSQLQNIDEFKSYSIECISFLVIDIHNSIIKALTTEKENYDKNTKASIVNARKDLLKGTINNELMVFLARREKVDPNAADAIVRTLLSIDKRLEEEAKIEVVIDKEKEEDDTISDKINKVRKMGTDIIKQDAARLLNEDIKSKLSDFCKHIGNEATTLANNKDIFPEKIIKNKFDKGMDIIIQDGLKELDKLNFTPSLKVDEKLVKTIEQEYHKTLKHEFDEMTKRWKNMFKSLFYKEGDRNLLSETEQNDEDQDKKEQSKIDREIALKAIKNKNNHELLAIATIEYQSMADKVGFEKIDDFDEENDTASRGLRNNKESLEIKVNNKLRSNTKKEDKQITNSLTSYINSTKKNSKQGINSANSYHIHKEKKKLKRIFTERWMSSRRKKIN